MATTLKAHPVWRNVTEAVATIDPEMIATQHIKSCNGEIKGYWDDSDQFYELIRFDQTPTPELISSSLGITPDEDGGIPWLNLKYSLKISSAETSIGELSLILNDSLEVIDENWLIDLHSPYLKFLQPDT
jgi:hypothetical protein